MIALSTSTIATILGLFAARASVRYAFPGKTATMGLIMLPLVGVSIIMWTVILERTVALKRLDRGGTSTAAMLGRLENREEPVAGSGIEEVLLEAFRSSRTGNLKLDCALLDQHAWRSAKTCRAASGS